MKVCHMTSAHGVEDVRIFHKECISLAKAGYEVYLVECGESYDKNGVHIIGVGEIPKNRLKRMTQGARTVYRKALELDCDIYHFHDPELLPYGIKLKRHGKKVIFDSHENVTATILEKKYIPSFLRPIIAHTYERYQKQQLERLNAVITVSPHIFEKIKPINFNTVMVTNYPILTQYNQNRCVSSNRICFVGGVTSQWSHEIIVKALSNCNVEVYYDVYGKSDKHYVDKLYELDENNRFNYKGVISHDDVMHTYQNYACGIAICKYNANMGGRKGSLGNTKLFEYMMAGLPVICTDFDTWKDIVEIENCGICVNPNDSDGIKRAIEYIISNPEIARDMGERGRLAVESKYSWEIQAQKLIGLYERL